MFTGGWKISATPVQCRCDGTFSKLPISANNTYYQAIEQDNQHVKDLDLCKNKNLQPSFHQFGDLPAELRLRIWRAALPDPRLIHFHRGEYQSNNFVIAGTSRPFQTRNILHESFRKMAVNIQLVSKSVERFSWKTTYFSEFKDTKAKIWMSVFLRGE